MLKPDYTQDEKLEEFAHIRFRDGYMVEGEKSPQDALVRACNHVADNEEMAKRLYSYLNKHWFMFSTPALTNSGTKRGLQISCYLNYVPDSRKGLTEHYTENAYLSSMGGGVGGYWGHIRSDGTKTSGGSQSSGSIPFLHVVDSEVLAFSQGKTRRGAYAAYQDISHPEVSEFLDMRKPSGGDIHRKCLNLHHGINLSDSFMKRVYDATRDKDAPSDWALIDPHSNEIVRVVDVKALWQKILENRLFTGEPYISFIDRMNEKLPDYQKAKGLKVHHSNLCSEITLATNEDRTAVCCLSSVNLEKWDEWKDDPYFIPDMIRMLDNMIENFIQTAPEEMSKAKYSATMERSLGLGAMGWHYLLQSKGIPFESAIAEGLNRRIFGHIKAEATRATQELAKERGEAPDALGYGVRNVHLLAIAPNASSAILSNVTSPGIEPFRANAYVHRTNSGNHLVRNRYLEKLLEEKGKNTLDVWKDIITNNGSVQHLDFLSDYEKDVFKTAPEIDQHWIVHHAAVRQQYICQAQSVNLFFQPGVDIKYVHDVHMAAWQKGLKTLYYCRTEGVRNAEVVSQKVERVRIPDDNECLSCES